MEHLEVAGQKGLPGCRAFLPPSPAVFISSLNPPPLSPYPHLPPPPAMTLPQARDHAISTAFCHKKPSPRHQNAPGSVAVTLGYKVKQTLLTQTSNV